MRGATLAVFCNYALLCISIHAPHAGCDGNHDCGCTARVRFQSTHPMRGATGNEAEVKSICKISIHAPHAGCDVQIHRQKVVVSYFNPRTPCGVRHLAYTQAQTAALFQSTHPMRGATNAAGRCYAQNKYFNPRTPCGVRQHKLEQEHSMACISIHAPHAGCDLRKSILERVSAISIHAPHAGCDRCDLKRSLTSRYFNPRTPCGVRHRAPCIAR